MKTIELHHHDQDKELKRLGIAEFYFPGYWSGKLKVSKELSDTISCLILAIFEDSNEII